MKEIIKEKRIILMIIKLKYLKKVQRELITQGSNYVHVNICITLDPHLYSIIKIIEIIPINNNNNYIMLLNLI